MGIVNITTVEIAHSWHEGQILTTVRRTGRLPKPLTSAEADERRILLADLSIDNVRRHMEHFCLEIPYFHRIGVDVLAEPPVYARSSGSETP